MIFTQLHDPRLVKLQARLARIPRWAWIAFFIGAIIPVVITVVLIVAAAFVTGAIVMSAVLVAGTVLGLVWKLFHRHNDGRRNCQIVVRNVRMIDP